DRPPHRSRPAPAAPSAQIPRPARSPSATPPRQDHGSGTFPDGGAVNAAVRSGASSTAPPRRDAVDGAGARHRGRKMPPRRSEGTGPPAGGRPATRWRAADSGRTGDPVRTASSGVRGPGGRRRGRPGPLGGGNGTPVTPGGTTGPDAGR